MTDDGTLGERGSIVDALPDTVERSGAEVVYAAGRPGLAAGRRRVRAEPASCPAQVAVEERMGCGYGLCHTCVGPGRAQGRHRLRPRARVRGRPGVQPGARAVGPLALGAATDAADTAGLVGLPRVRWTHGAQRSARSPSTSAGLMLPTPVMIAAGCAGTGRELSGLVDLRKVGAVVSRSITLESRPGSAHAADRRDRRRASSGRRGCRTRASTRSSPTELPRLARRRGARGRLDRRRLARGVRSADRRAAGTPGGLGDRGLPLRAG